jgi:hypothetical protein
MPQKKTHCLGLMNFARRFVHTKNTLFTDWVGSNVRLMIFTELKSLSLLSPSFFKIKRFKQPTEN